MRQSSSSVPVSVHAHVQLFQSSKNNEENSVSTTSSTNNNTMTTNVGSMANTNTNINIVIPNSNAILNNAKKDMKRIFDPLLCLYEKDQHIDILTPIEMSIAVSKITLEIYPKSCWLYTKPEHADNHTCLILKLLGYRGEKQGQDRTCQWAATQKVIMEQVAIMRNQMIESYKILACHK